jgi:hypothetical protein
MPDDEVFGKPGLEETVYQKIFVLGQKMLGNL